MKNKLLTKDLVKQYQKLYNDGRPKKTKRLTQFLAKIHLKLVFKALLMMLGEAKSGDKIGIFEFGVFHVTRSKRKPDQFRNPMTNEPFFVRPRLRIRFAPGKELMKKLKEN